MLSATNLSYKIGNKTLLNDVSVQFDAGKLNLIIGPNGAGKSTLIRALCGQIKPQTGQILYGGRDINSYSVSELAKMRAVLSQNIELAFPLSVSEVVMMGRYPHFVGKPQAQDVEACEAAMQFFDVQDLTDRNYMTLSGGEKQRVHFARVLAQIWFYSEGVSRYLILDEPLTFLDVHYQFDFMYKIVELLKQRDVVVVGVVHDLNLAAKFGDKITLIDKGQIRADGDKHTVLSPENIKAAYQLTPVIHQRGEGMYLFFD